MGPTDLLMLGNLVAQAANNNSIAPVQFPESPVKTPAEITQRFVDSENLFVRWNLAVGHYLLTCPYFTGQIIKFNGKVFSVQKIKLSK